MHALAVLKRLERESRRVVRRDNAGRGAAKVQANAVLHVVLVRSDLVVRGLQLLLKRLVFVRLRLPVLRRREHAASSSLSSV